MLSRAHQKCIQYGLFSVVFMLLLYHFFSTSSISNVENVENVNNPKTSVSERDDVAPKYNRSMPLIFIGGMPRSGTTLFRVMLDAHPDIRCGEETRVVPVLLSISKPWFNSKAEAKRLKEAGLTSDILHDAIAAFIQEIITKHGKPAPRLCNKDPFTLSSAVQLHLMFPNAKFILLIRDGRAVVHSIISRQVGITGFDTTDYRKCLFQWNQRISDMHSQCLSLGSEICMPVYYEQLVLHPRQWMEDILQFLGVEWNELVLHHDQFVNKPGGISISKLERSSDQVIKPINLEALSKWVGQIPEDVVRDMESLAPMLAKLGYDPNANPPNYGKPDTFVVKNTYFLKKYEKQWAIKEQEIIQQRQFFKSQYKKKKPNEHLHFPQ